MRVAILTYLLDGVAILAYPMVALLTRPMDTH